MRVVSLIASATEIVHALGAGGHLVGRSHECDYPPQVTALPAVTRPKFAVDGSSYRIDERIKAIVEQGLSVYHVDAERLAALRPDLILTQSQCEVCAVSERDVTAALHAYAGDRPKVVSLRPNALADVWKDIDAVAHALDRTREGSDLVASMRHRMEQVVRVARGVPACPTVACIEWIEPLMAAGNWMPELVEMAGGTSLFGEAGRHSPWMRWEDLRAADPDVLLVSPCGFDLDTTRRELPALASLPGWSELRAVRAGRVALADGNQFFHRPGPRLVESLEILLAILHPKAGRTEGPGWSMWH